MLKVVISIYSLTIFFLFLTASATYYALSHPELGLEEKYPQTQAYISKYGLEGGVLRVFLIDLLKVSAVWPVLLSYYLLGKIFKRLIVLIQATSYSLTISIELYSLTFWILDATNDISWILYGSCSSFIIVTFGLWQKLPFYLILGFFLILCPIMYRLIRSMHISMRIH